MRLEVMKLLTDMREAARDVLAFTAGKTVDDFRQEKLLRMAVERGFEIIGEALTQLRKLDQSLAESITDWRAIIGFRNVPIHGYAQVDNDKTWDIVQSELPILLSEVEARIGTP